MSATFSGEYLGTGMQRLIRRFARVNRYQGLFYFDSSFRPVPLEQHFIGVAGKARSQASIRNMEQVVFDKVCATAAFLQPEHR